MQVETHSAQDGDGCYQAGFSCVKLTHLCKRGTQRWVGMESAQITGEAEGKGGRI